MLENSSLEYRETEQKDCGSEGIVSMMKFVLKIIIIANSIYYKHDSLLSAITY